MRLPPLDIYNKEFRRAVSGYNKGDVDTFVEEVGRDYEALTRENVELKQQVEELGKRLADYARLEESIRKAMVLAQNTADEARSNARRESEIIIEEARQEASRITEAARAQARQTEESMARVQQQRDRFLQEFSALLRSHLSAIEHPFREDALKLPPGPATDR